MYKNDTELAKTVADFTKTLYEPILFNYYSIFYFELFNFQPIFVTVVKDLLK